MTRSVTKRGIVLKGELYIHPDLARRVGQLVQVFPAPPNRLFVRDLTGAQICIAEVYVPVDTTGARS
jgi:hypothetical protein